MAAAPQIPPRKPEGSTHGRPPFPFMVTFGAPDLLWDLTTSKSEWYILERLIELTKARVTKGLPESSGVVTPSGAFPKLEDRTRQLAMKKLSASSDDTTEEQAAAPILRYTVKQAIAAGLLTEEEGKKRTGDVYRLQVENWKETARRNAAAAAAKAKPEPEPDTDDEPAEDDPARTERPAVIKVTGNTPLVVDPKTKKCIPVPKAARADLGFDFIRPLTNFCGTLDVTLRGKTLDIAYQVNPQANSNSPLPKGITQKYGGKTPPANLDSHTSLENKEVNLVFHREVRQIVPTLTDADISAILSRLNGQVPHSWYLRALHNSNPQMKNPAGAMHIAKSAPEKFNAGQKAGQAELWEDPAFSKEKAKFQRQVELIKRLQR